MDAIIHPASPLTGTLRVPPDKAICHRAVLLGAVAEGRTVIRPWPSADDCQRTLAVVEALGVPVRRQADAVELTGVGLQGLRAPSGGLCCGESGTTLRLSAGLLAGQPFTATLTAGPSLSGRPMRRIIEPLSSMGARLESAPTTRGGEAHPPLTIQGRRPLRAVRYESPVASAQVKSAILLAGLFADGQTTVVEPQPTRDHTERMLRRFGTTLVQDGRAVTLTPGRLTAPGELVLPGDLSSAAFFIVAALCVAGSRLTLEGVGLNPTRRGVLDVLRRMGARIDVRSDDDVWEPRGTITVASSPLRGITLEPAEVPGVIDELPILMVAAACAHGPTRLSGAGELRVKETDRIQSMVTGLQRLGAAIRMVGPETLEIEGGGLAGDATVESAADHRTAMSLAVAALAARAPVTIRGAECVAKSFPEFFDQLRLLAGSPTVKTVDKAEGLC